MAVTHYRSCPLCEATCGVAIDVEGAQVTAVRGDDADPFSRGYLCPKATALAALHADPDRLRTPLVRGADGELRPASWAEAFAVAIDRLAAIKRAHGADAIALYLGNPSAHSLDLMTFGPVLTRALGTRQRYSASSADQLPKMVSAALMFGGGLAIPVPDLDRTDRLLIAPNDLRTVDATRASEIYAGRFVFAGKIVTSHGRSIFELDPPSDDWEANLLGFGWLRNLSRSALAMPAARSAAIMPARVLFTVPRPFSQQAE